MNTASKSMGHSRPQQGKQSVLKWNTPKLRSNLGTGFNNYPSCFIELHLFSQASSKLHLQNEPWWRHTVSEKFRYARTQDCFAVMTRMIPTKRSHACVPMMHTTSSWKPALRTSKIRENASIDSNSCKTQKTGSLHSSSLIDLSECLGLIQSKKAAATTMQQHAH